MKELKDKVAVVTGAASGIGLAIAEHLAAEGMKIVLADIEQGALDKTEVAFKARGATVLAVRCDVSKGAEVEALAKKTVDEFGAVHVICNNAGVVPPGGPLWERTEADWQWVLGPNLWGVIHGVRAFVPLMLAQDSECHVVNTSSMAGLVSIPYLGIYNVTKHAVVTLSETLHRELEAVGAKVKVSVLCPSWVVTNLGDAARNRPPELQNPDGGKSSQEEAIDETVQGFLDGGLSTEQVAKAVLDAIKEEQLYILTNPELMPLVRARMEDILENRNPAGLPVF